MSPWCIMYYIHIFFQKNFRLQVLLVHHEILGPFGYFSRVLFFGISHGPNGVPPRRAGTYNSRKWRSVVPSAGHQLHHSPSPLNPPVDGNLCFNGKNPSLRRFFMLEKSWPLPLLVLTPLLSTESMYILYAHIFDPCFFSFLSPNFAASNSASHPPAMCSSRLTEHYLSPGHITKPNITLAQVTTNLQYLILPVWVWLGFARIAGTEIHPKGHISWGIFLLLITFRKGPAKMCIYKWMFPWQQKQHVLPHKAYPYSKS